MNIRSLRALVKLGENNCDFGIHKQLGIPRSTLWAYIDELEKETGLTLIARKKQNNTLTEEGRNFIPYARQVIKIFEEGVENSSSPDSTETPSGEVIIATTAAIGSSWLLPSLKTFQKLFPKIRIRIIADDYISTTTELVADILLRPISDKDFLVRHWSIPYQMALWASPQYLEENGVPQKPLDLLHHSVLGYGEYIFSYFVDVDWHLKGRFGEMPRLNPRLTINSTTSLYLAAQQGIGICSAAMQSNLFYSPDPESALVRVLPDVWGPKVSVCFCTKKDVSPALARNVEIFNDFFLKYLKNLGVTIVPEEEATDPSHEAVSEA